MDKQLLLQLLDYAWVVLFVGSGWVVKISMRTSALEREILAIHKQRDEDEKRRAEQRREMLKAINHNHHELGKKLDRLVDRLLS